KVSTVFFLVGLVLMFFFASALVKFSGFLVKKSKISWKHSCIFAAMLFVGTIALGIMRKVVPLEIPIPVNIVISVGLEALLASAYFKNRAVDRSGIAIGARRAAFIGGTLFTLAMAGAIVLLTIKTVLQV